MTSSLGPAARSQQVPSAAGLARAKRVIEGRRSQRWLACAAALCAVVVGPGCKSSNPDPQTSSETNFLQHCDSSCGDGLTCLCGVCTKACTGGGECSDLTSESQCVPVPERPDGGTEGTCQQGATCDVACVTNADCQGLGGSYHCELGFCRKGALICPSTSLPPGDEQREIVVGGTTRAYTLHVPPGYAGTVAVPLVLDFHPMGLPLDWERTNSGYAALSDQQGFIVVWPQGLEDSWNIGPCCTTTRTIDDFAFARAIVRQLSNEACVDPTRVYAVGFSMGGAMAYYLACKEAEVFAAVAASSFDLAVDTQVTCEPSRPVTEISFRGSADTVVPYGGGTTTPPGHPELAFDVLGAVGTLQKWASLDGCTGSPSAEDANGCSTYSTCKDGTQVTLCTTQGGTQVVGDANLAWDVLSKHPMP